MSASDASTSDYRTVPFTGPDRAALATLIQSFGALEPLLGYMAAVDPDHADMERLAAALAAQGQIGAARRALATLLLGRVAGTPRTTDAELGAATAALAEQVRAAPVPALNGAPPPPADTLVDTDPPAIIATEALLREIGLEELDVSVHLLISADDAEPELALDWMPVPVETAHVWLLESLYRKVEASVAAGPPLLGMEREASRWWFEQWTGPSPESWEDDDEDADDDFTQTVREQEWSLVERPTLALDAPVVTWFCTTTEFQNVPPRQQRMARALRRSFVSVFAVRSAEGFTSVLEDLADGRQYTIHEHNQPLAYEAGWAAVGRLIPFEGNRYLRSPGTLLFLPPPRGRTSDLAAGFAMAADRFSPAIALEMLISTVVSRVRVPRDIVPAPSRAEACEWRNDLMDALNDENLREPIPFDAAPAELRRLAKANRETTEVYGYAVDEVVGAWADALSRQCEGEGTGRRRRQPGKRPRKGGRKKRKKRGS